MTYHYIPPDIHLELLDYGQVLEGYILMAATYIESTPSRALDILREAESLCLAQYGASNDMILKIVYQTAQLYENQLYDFTSARETLERWLELTTAIYGHEHPVTASARAQVYRTGSQSAGVHDLRQGHDDGTNIEAETRGTASPVVAELTVEYN